MFNFLWSQSMRFKCILLKYFLKMYIYLDSWILANKLQDNMWRTFNIQSKKGVFYAKTQSSAQVVERKSLSSHLFLVDLLAYFTLFYCHGLTVFHHKSEDIFFYSVETVKTDLDDVATDGFLSLHQPHRVSSDLLRFSFEECYHLQNRVEPVTHNAV